MPVIEISPFFGSVYNAPSTLKYVENKGDLTVGRPNLVTNVYGTLKNF